MDDLITWLREEHTKVRNLLDRLREKVGVVPRANLGPWIEEVRDRFDHLRAHLTKHMALEEFEEGGYLSAVLERRPALSEKVEWLKHQHAEFIRIMDGIHRAVHELTPEDRLLVRDCCRRIEDLLSYIDDHDDDENMLVTYAFTQDLGTRGAGG